MRFLALLGLCTVLSAVDIVVAPNGDDSAAGTVSTPLASPLRAREHVRRALAAGERTVVVHLRAGTYLMSEALHLGPEDTAPGAHVRWQGEEAVVLSGGIPLRGWKSVPGGRWTCALPLDRTNPGGLPSLSRGGDLLLPSRWPTDKPAVVVTGRDGVLVLKPRPPAGTGELLALFAWGASRALVSVDDLATRQVHLPADLPWAMSQGKAPNPGRAVFIDGLATPTLDCWRLLAGGQVELAAAAQPKDGEIRVAALPEILVIEGQPGRPVVGIEISGITIAHSAWPRPAAGLEGVQAGQFATKPDETSVEAMPGAVRIAWADGVALTGVTVQATAGGGIVLGAGCHAVRIERCTIRGNGGSGIMVGWRGAGLESASVDWADPIAIPRDNLINRCRISACGRLDLGSVGIADLFSAGTVITGNLIEDLPYTGISLGMRWDTSSTSQRRARVEGNHIRRVMQRMLDGAGIYTLGWQPGAQITGNLIEDIGGPGLTDGAPAGGLFFDEGSKGIQVEGNVISRIHGEPIRLNGCAQSWLILGHNIVVADGQPVPLPPAVAEGVGP